MHNVSVLAREPKRIQFQQYNYMLIFDCLIFILNGEQFLCKFLFLSLFKQKIINGFILSSAYSLCPLISLAYSHAIASGQAYQTGLRCCIFIYIHFNRVCRHIQWKRNRQFRMGDQCLKWYPQQCCLLVYTNHSDSQKHFHVATNSVNSIIKRKYCTEP